jgi:hypothetical protein
MFNADTPGIGIEKFVFPEICFDMRQLPQALTCGVGEPNERPLPQTNVYSVAPPGFQPMLL